MLYEDELKMEEFYRKRQPWESGSGCVMYNLCLTFCDMTA